MPAFNAVRFNEPTCKALYKRVYERSGINRAAGADEGLRGGSETLVTNGSLLVASRGQLRP